MSHDHVRAIVAAAPEIKPEPPRPLMRELPPADPFPVAALGSVLGPPARAIHDRGPLGRQHFQLRKRRIGRAPAASRSICSARASHWSPISW